MSARFFATYAGGYAVWLAYGVSIGLTLAVTLQVRGSLLRPVTWGGCRGSRAQPA